MQEAADDLVSLYKRVSLDDDLDDALRSELLSQLSAGRLSFKFPLNHSLYTMQINLSANPLKNLKTMQKRRCQQHSGDIEAGVRGGGKEPGRHCHRCHG